MLYHTASDLYGDNDGKYHEPKHKGGSSDNDDAEMMDAACDTDTSLEFPRILVSSRSTLYMQYFIFVDSDNLCCIEPRYLSIEEFTDRIARLPAIDRVLPLINGYPMDAFLQQKCQLQFMRGLTVVRGCNKFSESSSYGPP